MQGIAYHGQAQFNPQLAIVYQLAGDEPCRARAGSFGAADYLGESGQDPRRAFVERLIDTLGEHGPVFVYNQGFEGSCLPATGRGVYRPGHALAGD